MFDLADLDRLQTYADFSPCSGDLHHAQAALRRVLPEIQQLVQMEQKLRAAIREHRDMQADDRCHMDDGKLYEVLGEKIPTSASQLNAPEIMLEDCKRFIACRHDPSKPYLSPQREIDRLRFELARAEQINANWQELARDRREVAHRDLRVCEYCGLRLQPPFQYHDRRDCDDALTAQKGATNELDSSDS